MEYTYYLPDVNGHPTRNESESNSIVIIGANGSGKSKLGAWIDKQHGEDVHRIGAQRKLNFNENIDLKNYDYAKNLVLYGSEDSKYGKIPRWGSDDNIATTIMIDDFENALAALIALKNNESDIFIENYKRSCEGHTVAPEPPYTSIDKLIDIWNDVLPQRNLSYSDAKFFASLRNSKYPATQMSDGERSVLYLVAQVLCVPENKTLVIDEPELHLHPSIMNRLWRKLEDFRKDCLFIYITHDTQFAAQHFHSDKIWVKDFDGVNWKLEKLGKTELPEDLLFEILGSRKPVLFVEGEKNSLDTALYELLYPEYHIINCGSCSQVIQRTKSFNKNLELHNLKVYGIIDRDYRLEKEIKLLEKDNIYTLGVAEVENLFIVEEVINFLANHMGQDNNHVLAEVKNFVINTKFSNMIDQQICRSVAAELKYMLSAINISDRDAEDAKISLKSAINEINFDDVQKKHEEVFRAALDNNNYNNILKLFNEKSVSKSVGKFFGLDNSKYQQTIINLLRSLDYDQRISIFSRYLPVFRR